MAYIALRKYFALLVFGTQMMLLFLYNAAVEKSALNLDVIHTMTRKKTVVC